MKCVLCRAFVKKSKEDFMLFETENGVWEKDTLLMSDIETQTWIIYFLK